MFPLTCEVHKKPVGNISPIFSCILASLFRLPCRRSAMVRYVTQRGYMQTQTLFAQFSYLVHNHGLIAKNLCLGYWVSLLANFAPLGDWRVKLAVYMVNLLVLAVLQLQPYYGRSAAVVSERIQ